MWAMIGLTAEGTTKDLYDNESDEDSSLGPTDALEVVSVNLQVASCPSHIVYFIGFCNLRCPFSETTCYCISPSIVGQFIVHEDVVDQAAHGDVIVRALVLDSAIGQNDNLVCKREILG